MEQTNSTRKVAGLKENEIATNKSKSPNPNVSKKALFKIARA
ncbi:hypothetical protein [Leeuwenhoekiella blandensis]